MRLGKVNAVILTALCMSAGPLLAQIPAGVPPSDEIGLSSIFHGTTVLDLDRQGEIISCEVVEGVIIRNHFVYDFLEGVCDDLGDVPCNGRVTAVAERCSQMPSDGFGGEAGNLFGSYGRGDESRFRMCFDEAGTCTDVDEIAVSSGRSQSMGLAGDPNGSSRSVATVRPTRSFTIDGHRVRVPAGTAYTDVTFENPQGPFPANCLIDGCGFAGIGIRVN